MPLTAGKRDEENERFLNTLQRLTDMPFVPENFGRIDAEFHALELSLETLETSDGTALLERLSSVRMDFENLERFADFLSAGFPRLAKTVYENIQRESGTFSLVIFNKINTLKI
jgi:hypothetical protein